MFLWKKNKQHTIDIIHVPLITWAILFRMSGDLYAIIPPWLHHLWAPVLSGSSGSWYFSCSSPLKSSTPDLTKLYKSEYLIIPLPLTLVLHEAHSNPTCSCSPWWEGKLLPDSDKHLEACILHLRYHVDWTHYLGHFLLLLTHWS